MRMKIAFVIEQLFDPDSGGVQRSTSKLVKIFQKKGFNIIIISTHGKDNQKINWEGIPLYYVNQKISNELQIIFSEENISFIINQAGYSYTITNYLLNNISAKTKIINTMRINPLNFFDNHKLIIKDYLKKRGLSFLNNMITRKLILSYHIIKQRFELNYIVKNVDAFVILSDRFKPELYKLVPRLKKYDDKIYGINNPFEKPVININDIKKENIILHVGRLNILQKRVDLLLQIWQILYQKITDWQFWIVGDGPEKSNMENFCSENSLTNVKFFGKQRPNDFYKKAKIFHLTSAYEGFGNVIVEAQSYGCVPVLFNSYSSAKDIVKHNENGILINPFNIHEYVNATLELVNNPAKLEKLKLAGYLNVDKFSFENTYKKWENLFNILNDEAEK